MRDIKRIVSPYSARPQNNIKIEHARAPPLPTSLATEMSFDFVEPNEQNGRFEIAGNDCGGVGINSLRGANRLALNDRRLRKHVDVGHFERVDRFGQYALRWTNKTVALV